MKRYQFLSTVLLLCYFLLPPDSVFARNSPFGVGLPEVTPNTEGVFGSFFAWVAFMQSNFYKALTDSVQRLEENGTAAWFLILLSFSYGVFHAVGPGHGKAVISTYVLANGQTLLRGVAISMVSAMVQAMTAIVLIGITAVALNLTSIAITQTTHLFEIGSYAMITVLGLWLVWVKAVKPTVHTLKSVIVNSGESERKNLSDNQSADNSNTSCCHSHAVNLDSLNGEFNLSSAWSVIVAIGMRPCSGALIVLVFAFSQGLAWAGVISTLAMGFGTGLTVATLASLAVGAREITVRIVGSQSVSLVHRGIEIAGAALVFLIGFTLLITSIGWGG